MSRLDSFIRRMSAQRDILNSLVEPLRSVEGAILEFGLGSGRTLDHLRERFPERRILVFERDTREGPWLDATAAELVKGDIRDTARSLPDACAALVHADIDTGHSSADRDLLEWLPDLAVRLLAPSGIVASSIRLVNPRLLALQVPASVNEDRYFLARRLP